MSRPALSGGIGGRFISLVSPCVRCLSCAISHALHAAFCVLLCLRLLGGGVSWASPTRRRCMRSATGCTRIIRRASTGLCLNDIQKKTPCDECSAVCPAGLSIHDAAPDWHGCTDCGLCVTACPAQAINASSAYGGRVEAVRASARGCIVFSCDRYGGGADVVTACLASLSWDELAALALELPRCS